MRTIAAAALLLIPCTAYGFQVEVFPPRILYVQRINPDHHYVDLDIHNILLVNDSSKPLSVEKAVVEVLDGDAVVETRTIRASEIRETTAAIGKNGQVASAQMDTDFPWDHLRDSHFVIGTGAKLAAHEVAAIKNVFLTVQGMPTAVRIRAFAKGSQASIVVPISQKTPNSYHSPLQGVWYMRGAQDITSHHRWNANTEFAVDFFKYGDNGLPWRTDGRSAADFYAFGLPVMAAADGVVVAAENTATQNYDVRLQRAGESDEAYDARLTAYNLAMMKTDPYKALIGNYVVIQHGDEYSSYKHLKTGSVLVKPGDHVTAGQQIASVGDTGDSNFVHLHFQISEGVDPLTARSIPFTFSDLRPSGGDLGRIVRTSK